MRVRMHQGYRLIHMPDHPAAFTSDNWKGFVYEHVMVAEKFLGRRLRAGEVCHHLDLNRANNRPENIIVLLRSQHNKIHAWLAKGAPGVEHERFKRIKEGKEEVSPTHEANSCKNCGKPLEKGRKAYCSNKCRGRRTRKVTWPTKAKLTAELEQMSYSAVGRKYGVSDNTVRKWAEKYKLI